MAMVVYMSRRVFFCLSSADLLPFSALLIAAARPAVSLPWETGRHQQAPDQRIYAGTTTPKVLLR